MCSRLFRQAQHVLGLAVPVVRDPRIDSHMQPFLHQVGKDTEAQAFLGKLDTDREVGGMVDATVSWTKVQGCNTTKISLVNIYRSVRSAAWWTPRCAGTVRRVGHIHIPTFMHECMLPPACMSSRHC